MNTKEFKKALRTCRGVLAYTKLWKEDAAYVEVKKSSLHRIVKDLDFDAQYEAEVRDNILYIN